MKNIMNLIEQIYQPVKALVVFKNEHSDQCYVESYDMDSNGCAINAHPLSVQEGNELANLLNSSPEAHQGYLTSKGLLPDNVLFIKAKKDGFLIWYTPPMEVNLFFRNNLSIPDGKAWVPAMVWKGSVKSLAVYALAQNYTTKPLIDTPLYHAPFFNVYESGNVCMGNINIKIDQQTGLEELMSTWQLYFFNSKFSHLNLGVSPVKGNIVQLWQKQLRTGKNFPVKSLIKNGKTIKYLIV